METRACRIFFVLIALVSPMLSGETGICLGLESPGNGAQDLTSLSLDLDQDWGQVRADLDFPVRTYPDGASGFPENGSEGLALRNFWIITPVLRTGYLQDSSWLALARGRSVRSIFSLTARGKPCTSPLLIPDTQEPRQPGAELSLAWSPENTWAMQLDLASLNESCNDRTRNLLSLSLALRFPGEDGAETGIRAGVLGSSRPGELMIQEPGSDWFRSPIPPDWRSIQILQGGFSWTSAGFGTLLAAQVSACPDGLTGLDLAWLLQAGLGGRIASPANLAFWAAWRDRNFRTLESSRPGISWETGARLGLNPFDCLCFELIASWKGAGDDGLAPRYPDPADLLVHEALYGCGNLGLGMDLDWLRGGLALRLGLDRDREGQPGLEASLSVCQTFRPTGSLTLTMNAGGGISADGPGTPGFSLAANVGAGFAISMPTGRASAEARLKWEDISADAGAIPAGPVLEAKLEFERRIQAPAGAGTGPGAAGKGAGTLPEAFLGFRVGLIEGIRAVDLELSGLAEKLEFRCWLRMVFPELS